MIFVDSAGTAAEQPRYDMPHYAQTASQRARNWRRWSGHNLRCQAAELRERRRAARYAAAMAWAVQH